ncbi:hypothetical protein V7S43_015863 [Phytophthora oleae]|uniref:Uncharacterized protein n=1 Tax=Phytophthora oleae TaxID=2107226 RepID=A0ABD3EZJ1_9STRA
MSAKGANPDAKASSRKKAAKLTSKPVKPRGKASALQEATNVTSKAISSPSNTAAAAFACQRRSRSPSLPPDDRPNPRFVDRDHSPGSWSPSQQEETLVSYSGDESDGDDAEGKPEAGAPIFGHGGDTTPPVRNLTLAEKRQRARAILAEEKVPRTYSKKRHASQSPCQDLARSGDFEDIFGPDSEEEGQVEEPREITDDLDEQQELYQAAQQPVHAARAAVGGSHQHGGDSAHQRGYYLPD